jgi:hypothetical protein
LNLSNDILVSKFAFKCNLHRYIVEKAVGPGHVECANILISMANFRREEGEYEQVGAALTGVRLVM